MTVQISVSYETHTWLLQLILSGYEFFAKLLGKPFSDNYKTLTTATDNFYRFL